jgi:glyoxylase-like metal-dependent hydrolase (beta-lactamase superfamily II)
MLKTTHYDEVVRIDAARTIAGRGYYWTTAYLVDGLLIDSGCAHTAGELVAWVRDERLTCLLNTHSHEDHIGANGPLQIARAGLKINVHPCAVSVLADPRATLPQQPYRLFMWGRPEPSTSQAVADGEWIETENHRFQVIYTPGHSPDHICLYEPERGWLFSGDLFIGGRDRALRADYDIWGIIDSLQRVAALPLRKLFPGCARVRSDPERALADKIAYLEETGSKVLELHREGLSTGAIARRLLGGPMFIEYFTLGHFSRRGLVVSYLSRAEQH